jgi:hypothetical protein
MTGDRPILPDPGDLVGSPRVRSNHFYLYEKLVTKGTPMLWIYQLSTNVLFTLEWCSL